MPTATTETVRLAKVTDDLGLPRNTRTTLIVQGLVTPVEPVIKGRPTRIPVEEADLLRRAAAVAAAVGIAFVIVLKVLRAL